MSDNIKLVLAEDQELVRGAIKSLIESDSRFQVVGEAGDGIVAMEMVRATEPDLIVMELALPKLNGFNTISQLKRRHPKVKIMVLTSAQTPSVWVEALEMGVNGIATKSVAKESLLNGLEQVVAGKLFVDDVIKPHVMAVIDDASPIKKKRSMRKLSVREKQVTKLIAEGFKTKDIAVMLDISDRTVSKHRENLMTKLGATSPAEITHYATDTGLTKVDIVEIE